MRTIIFLLFFCGLYANAFSQAKLWPKPTLKMGMITRDTSIQKRLEELLQKHPPLVEPMPNAMNTITLQEGFTYKANNGDGFDIYDAKTDRMPVLVPDSANNASLKNYGRVTKIIPGTMYRVPKIFIVPSQKETMVAPKN